MSDSGLSLLGTVGGATGSRGAEAAVRTSALSCAVALKPAGSGAAAVSADGRASPAGLLSEPEIAVSCG